MRGRVSESTCGPYLELFGPVRMPEVKDIVRHGRAGDRPTNYIFIACWSSEKKIATTWRTLLTTRVTL